MTQTHDKLNTGEDSLMNELEGGLRDAQNSLLNELWSELWRELMNELTNELYRELNKWNK